MGGNMPSNRDGGRPVEARDIYRFKMPGAPQVSPDGTGVVLVVTQALREENEYRSRLHLVSRETGEVMRFTSGPRDEEPRWSPDGKHIAFVSDRAGSSQLFVIPVKGGEALQVTDLEGPVTEPAWSPDGKQLAFVHRVELEQAERELLEEIEDDDYESDVMSYRRLKYKFDGEGFWDGKWRQLWVVDIDGGEPRRITEGEYDFGRPAWSPDGTKLAFSADLRPEADHDMKTDIYTVEVETGDIEQLTDTAGPAEAPTWSPDGNRLAYYGHDGEFAGATVTRIWTVDAAGQEAPRCVTEKFDRNVGRGLGSDVSWGRPQYEPVWSADGSSLFSTAVNRGAANLYAFDVETGRVEEVTGGKRSLFGVSFSRDCSTAAYVSIDPKNPGELFVLDLGEGQEEQLSELNTGLVEELNLSEPEHLVYSGAEGWEVEGWVMKPTGYAEGDECPLILKIHGGPHGAYGHTFNHHFQLLAGEGYAVLYVNPRGSIGYGQDFVKATHHDWGGGDYEDIMAGVDLVLDQGFVDEERMGVTGLSFGGFMTDWIIGHTDRFRTAVAEVTTSNRYSQWATSDVGYFHGEWEFQGYPWASWENARMYLGRSPLSYVKNVDTPLLILQAQEDHRCPLEQAEQFYRALKVLQKEVQLVIFPGESHVFSRSGKPRHREERLVRISAWFTRDLAE